MIIVRNLVKKYKYYEKKEGLKGSIEGIFNRKYKDAVNDISFEIEDGKIVGLLA